ncbi:hypothetical protein L596_028581 [Steinernema carpocapsae]|uniref:Uncharacterized protein n=1 Tax=Steinernema carpocapsae TaxID=34508 RepID=A0A4U5LYW9_STECR|nr:hypothetical protein L596_028581 [Steinernema carpocapsae]
MTHLVGLCKLVVVEFKRLRVSLDEIEDVVHSNCVQLTELLENLTFQLFKTLCRGQRWACTHTKGKGQFRVVPFVLGEDMVYRCVWLGSDFLADHFSYFPRRSQFCVLFEDQCVIRRVLNRPRDRVTTQLGHNQCGWDAASFVQRRGRRGDADSDGSDICLPVFLLNKSNPRLCVSVRFRGSDRAQMCLLLFGTTRWAGGPLQTQQGTSVRPGFSGKVRSLQDKPLCTAPAIPVLGPGGSRVSAIVPLIKSALRGFDKHFVDKQKP